MAATAPTFDEFIEARPEFSDLGAPRVERQLALSARLLDAGAWGDFYGDAVELDAAHNLALARVSGAGVQGAFQGAVGPVNSVSAAGVSTSFATASPAGKSASADWYLKTVYGQQFLRLRAAVIPLGDLTC